MKKSNKSILFTLLIAASSITQGVHAGIIPSAPDADPDCVILFCAIAGFPSAAVAGPTCVQAFAEMIERIAPWPIEAPFGICTGFGGSPLRSDPDPAMSSFYNNTYAVNFTTYVGGGGKGKCQNDRCEVKGTINYTDGTTISETKSCADQNSDGSFDVKGNKYWVGDLKKPFDKGDAIQTKGIYMQTQSYEGVISKPNNVGKGQYVFRDGIMRYENHNYSVCNWD